MQNPLQPNQPPSLPELLQWNPWWIADPALSSITAQVDEATRTELIVVSLELHKEVLAAHMKATDRVIASLSKRTQTGPQRTQTNP